VRDSAGVQIVRNQGPSGAIWRLSDQPTLTIDVNGPAEEVPLDPVSVFRDATGRILVGDGNQAGWDGILVYSALGEFVETIGREGQGPGEFGQLWWAGSYGGDSIAAWDMADDNVAIFGPQGRFARDFALPRLSEAIPEGTYGWTPGALGPFSDGGFLTYAGGALELPEAPGPAWYKHRLLAVHPEGETWDTVGRYEFSQASWDGSQQEELLFASHVQEVPYGRDLIRANPESYEYQVLNRKGQLQQIVRRSFDRAPVQDADREAHIEWTVGMIRASPGGSDESAERARTMFEKMPSARYMPAFSKVLADDLANVWVERFRWFDPWSLGPNPKESVWDVFSSEGQWITEVVVPSRFLPQSVTRDEILGFRVDEFDVKHVEVYGIVRDELAGG
ncbi:MAG: 6-bladed beta-propeller, partial [Longimicrobiales bacterium]